MGRQRKHYTDKFKYEAVKEALKAGANRAEIAVKYNVSPSCLSEWVESFIEGKFETEEQKSMRQKIAELEAKNELMLKELGKKQLEIDLLKKTRISGGALETRRFRTGGCKRARLTVGEQCRILGISKAAYYDNQKKEAGRQKKKTENDKIRLEHAEIVFDEWLSR